MKRLRILLVDDHVLFREGIASLVAARTDMEVVGQAVDGLEAQEKARQLKPDLILMDIRMPNCDGLEATRRIKAEWPEARIVILTVSEEDADLFEAIKAGAQGYLLKNLRPAALFELIQGVSKGEAPISPSLAAKIIREFVQATQRSAPQGTTEVNLTGREKQILQYVAQGASNREIATYVCITEGTVKNHLHNILEKLHLHNRAQAAAYALREGLIATSLLPPVG
ncbi:MAG: response regulator transcription factor [Dehalococcoidia bacterium]|nr:response regulator transcription factor [Dehalococcoidia bacterium]